MTYEKFIEDVTCKVTSFKGTQKVPEKTQKKLDSVAIQKAMETLLRIRGD